MKINKLEIKNSSFTLPWEKINSFVGNHSNPSLTMYRPCPICGDINFRTLLVFDDFQFYTDSVEKPKRAKIQEVQCCNCHGVYLNPCYSETGFHYLFSEAGQSYGSTEGRPQEQIDWFSNRGLLDKGKVFLDAGCYEGRFLSMLPNEVRRLGVDIDLHAIKRGQERYSPDGVELIHGSFETFQSPVAPDVISMFHVLEHLADPFAVLCHLRSIAHEISHLVIEVPIIEFGTTNDINGFLSVQHMTHFSYHSLGQLMNRAGWEILERQQMPDYNGHRILAKPSQLSNKVIGDASDRLKALEYLAHWYRNLADISALIKSWPKVSRAVIWGGGAHSEFIYQVTPLFSLVPECEFLIVDSDTIKQNKSWRGLSIHSPEILKNIDWSDCLLIISSYGGQENIATAAEKMGVPSSAVMRLYDHLQVY
jgi:SAM-dependent methyltransferase